MRIVRYTIEALLLWILFWFFKILSPKYASGIGGWLGRSIGPYLAVNRKARRHLRLAFPEIDQSIENDILRGMWDNLGRIIGEYPHLERISRDYTTINNMERLAPYLEQDQPIIFIGGHLGNWEINGAAMLTQMEKTMTLTYRAPNNPWTAHLLDRCRTLNGAIQAYPKARESGRYIMQTLKEDGLLGILIDQKYNEGVEVNFFGAPAMTNPICVQLAQKYKCPLIPVRCERTRGCSFTLTPYDPLPVFDETGEKRPVADVLNDAHRLLEGWISERAEQWIWLHRRWRD